MIIGYKTWRKKGLELYGKDLKKWKFRCPICNCVQSGEDFEKLESFKGDWRSFSHFSCLGRWTENPYRPFGKSHKNKKNGCDYTSGGLFVVNKLQVKAPDSKNTPIFQFADYSFPTEKKRKIEKCSRCENVEAIRLGLCSDCYSESEYEERFIKEPVE